MTLLKAENIGADQVPSFIFRLQLCGGQYMARSRLIETRDGANEKDWQPFSLNLALIVYFRKRALGPVRCQTIIAN